MDTPLISILYAVSSVSVFTEFDCICLHRIRQYKKYDCNWQWNSGFEVER